MHIESPGNTLEDSPYKGKLIKVAAWTNFYKVKFENNGYHIRPIKAIGEEREWVLGLDGIFEAINPDYRGRTGRNIKFVEVLYGELVCIVFEDDIVEKS